MGKPWTPEERAACKKLLDQGLLQSVVAEKLTRQFGRRVTKGAVSGQKIRFERQAFAQSGAVEKRAVRASNCWDSANGRAALCVTDLPGHEGDNQFDADTGCRWPLELDGSDVSSDPADMQFCGKPRVNGKSYCTEHLARSIVAGSANRRVKASMKHTPLYRRVTGVI